MQYSKGLFVIFSFLISLTTSLTMMSKNAFAHTSTNQLEKEIVILKNQILELQNRVTALETTPTYECMANCGFFNVTNTSLLIFNPMRIQANSVAEAVIALENNCSAKNGILFAGIEYGAGLQRLVAVAKYTDIDLNNWICSKL